MNIHEKQEESLARPTVTDAQGKNIHVAGLSEVATKSTEEVHFRLR